MASLRLQNKQIAHSRINFLDLPAELRDYIYDFVFDSNLIGSKNLTLLLTCRQIYSEAKTMGFEKTLFRLPPITEWNSRKLFCRTRQSRLSKTTLESIRKIKYPYGSDLYHQIDIDRMHSTRTYHLPIEYIEIEVGHYLPCYLLTPNPNKNYLVSLIWSFPNLKEISFSMTGKDPEKSHGGNHIGILHSSFHHRVGSALFEDPKPLIVLRVGEPGVEFKSRYMWWFPVVLGPEIGASSRILRINWLM